MGIYGEQGASNNGAAEPVLGHPMYPPPYNIHNHPSYEQQQPMAQQQQPMAQQQQQQQQHQPGSHSPMAAPYPLGGYAHPESLNTGEWSSALCGCCSDCDVCCQTCWCPCVTFGQIAEVVDEGRTACVIHGTIYGLLCSVGIPCVYSFLWRQKLRRKFFLEKGCCGDFCVHCCCELCALCQEHRELQSRGLDPSLGWELARHHAQVAPTPAGGMQR